MTTEPEEARTRSGARLDDATTERLADAFERTDEMPDPGRVVRHPRSSGVRFEVYESAGQYRWRLKAASGEIIATGEAYATKEAAHRSIEMFRRLEFLHVEVVSV